VSSILVLTGAKELALQPDFGLKFQVLLTGLVQRGLCGGFLWGLPICFGPWFWLSPLFSFCLRAPHEPFFRYIAKFFSSPFETYTQRTSVG
jgi:hypothetical protein